MPKETAIRFRRALAIALALTAACALAACSGSASSPAGNASADHGGVQLAALQNPLANSKGAQSGSGYIVSSSDPITATTNKPSVARYPTGPDNDEVSTTGADPIRPCSFVSGSEARAITGNAVQVSAGMQGPTCIYEMRRAHRQVTVAVQPTRIAGLRRHARSATRASVRGRTGWCLRYGSTSLAVPLSGGRMLSVSAPCKLAKRFASRALGRVPR